MKKTTKAAFIAVLSLFSVGGYAQSCQGIAVKYTLDTVKTGPNWSVVYLQLPNGAHLDSIYGGFQRPAYSGTSLSYSCYSIGTTNDTNLVNPASSYYYPYTGPYSQWINMAPHNIMGKSNSYVQFSITTANGMLMDSVKIAYSCATGCSGIIKKYTLDYHGTGPTWSYVNLTLPNGALLDSVYGGIQRSGYSGAALSYSCYSDSSTNNVNLLNPSTSFYNPYTGPYSTWIDMRSYNVIGKSNSFIQISITETNGMVFDSAMIAYECYVPTGINNIVLSSAIDIYPNPATEMLHILNNGKQVMDISITDITGRLVYTSDFTSNVNVSNLQSGIYLILLKDRQGNIYTNKFIKE